MHDHVVDQLRDALSGGDVTPLGDLLADDVHWYGNFPGGGCRTRDEALDALRDLVEDGLRAQPHMVRAAGGRLVLRLDVARPANAGTIWCVLTLDPDGRIARVQDYSTQAAAEHDIAVRDGAQPSPSPVSGLVPFVHVADVERSIAFYRLLGFEVGDTYSPDGRPVWASLTSGGAQLMVAEAGEPVHPHEQAVLFYLYARDLVALRNYLVASGAAPGEIVDGTPGPDQEMRVTDPDGYCLMVAQLDGD